MSPIEKTVDQGEIETDFVVKKTTPPQPGTNDPAQTEKPISQGATAPTGPVTTELVQGVTVPAAEPAPKPPVESNLASDEVLPGMEKKEVKPVEPTTDPLDKTQEQIEEEERLKKEADEKLLLLEDVEEPKPDDKKEPKTEPGAFDYVRLAEDVGIELKENTYESFKVAHQQAIESAKKIVAPDLSKFNDQQKMIFNWLGNGGSLDQFFRPLKTYDDFLAKPDDEKVKLYLTSEKGLTDDQAQEEIDRLIDTDAFDDQVQVVDSAIMQLRERQFGNIIETIKRTEESNQQKVIVQRQKELGEIHKVLDEINDFMGIPIPSQTKAVLKKEVDNGKFLSANENAKSQVQARLFALFADKVVEHWKGKIKTAEDLAYNRGVVKYTERLHDIPPANEPTNLQRQAPAESTSPIGNVKDIDKDAKDGFAAT